MVWKFSKGLEVVSDTRNALQLLLEKGVFWRPDNARELQSVRRYLYECEPDVTLELVQQLTKHKACSEDTLRELLRTPAMKKHLASEATRFHKLGYDVRTAEQKAQEERQKEASRKWFLKDLMTRYNRERFMRKSGLNQSNTSQRDMGSPMLGLPKSVRNSTFQGRVVVTGPLN